MPNATIQYENSSLVIAGELDFSTAAILWMQSLPLLEKYSELNFDFSKVTSSNSAGLALLLEWLKYAKCKNKIITFHNLPKQILSIAKVCELEHSLSRSEARGEG